jgi:hypothetical protein
MSPERFEERVRESLSSATESPDPRQDDAVLGAAREAASEIRARRRGARRLWWVPASMAAAVGVVAIGLWSTVEHSDDTMRGSSAGGVMPGSGTTLTQPPERFDWEDQSGATDYRLTLRTADARVLWQSPSSRDSHVEVPHSIRFARDATYLWTVQYEGPVTSGSLGPFSFRLASN